MTKKSALLLIFFIGILSCNKHQIIEFPNTTTEYFDIIDQEFSGDLAFETTAYVEQYWRVVGNTGFNNSINKIAEELENSGFVNEDVATPEHIFTYRIEKRPLNRPTWEPVNAVVEINGEKEPLLQHSTNRNMIALNSYSTPEGGISGEVLHVKDVSKLDELDVKGKILFAETSPYMLLRQPIMKRGALGVLTYNNPSYLKPEINTTSIQFRSIPLDETHKPWAIAMSFKAKERLLKQLSNGKVILDVKVETKIYESEELTIVADIQGTVHKNERLVFSAHVQEPGANDNASGVGVALEMAKTTVKLINDNKIEHNRTLSFLWGDEIISTRRYVEEDSLRAKDIKWGISLDMVGENTDITGGTFLIEKMPDPSAVWTRGNDKHTEWGGQVLSLEQMKPHYLNDFLLDTFKEQGGRADWVVEVNPFEGGSDHVPFLRADIPSVLFWHFTDQFYHTDNDRIDKVSKTTLKNVGTAALTSAYTLINSDENTAVIILKNIQNAAIERLEEELKQSQLAINNGDELDTQLQIIRAWEDWYAKAALSVRDISENSQVLEKQIDETISAIKQKAEDIVKALD